jgi:hypothetical protein
VTSHPLLGAIYFSEYINQRNHGILVAPWEVENLPEEYQELYRALQKNEGRKRRKGALEGLFQAFRQKHPSYRKY